jgi:MFS family permease
VGGKLPLQAAPTAATLRPRSRLTRWAPALTNRNFRLFWLGQLVSLVGTSVQVVAEGWLVYELTQSTFWLGMVGLLGLLPVLPVSLVGGLLIDRFPRRKVILVTQIGLLLQAALFGLLASTGQLQLWQVIALYFVFGALLAIDNPARRAFLVELVGPEDLAGAVALNATLFNFSSLIGYGLAGVLIAAVGAGPTMLLNSATYLAPIVALLLMRLPDVRAEAAGVGRAAGGALLAGVKVLLQQPTLLAVMALMAVVGGLAYPVFGMMPAFAQDVLGVGAVGLGVLMAAGALGSVMGTVVVARAGSERRGRTLVTAALVLPVLVAAFPAAPTLGAACLLLVGIGMALLIVQSLAITVVQLQIQDRVRGRVMTLYSLLHAGSDTLGNVAVGSLAVISGLPLALAAGGLVSLLWAGMLSWRLPALRRME